YRRSGPMVPTTGASGSSSGRTGAPSTGPPSSPACAPPSAQSPPPAANATNPPLSKGPGRRALFYLDHDAIDLAVAAQHVDGAESLQVQPLEAAAPRSGADEMTGCASKCRKAKLDLPEPEPPISRTSAQSGIPIT